MDSVPTRVEPEQAQYAGRREKQVRVRLADLHRMIHPNDGAPLNVPLDAVLVAVVQEMTELTPRTPSGQARLVPRPGVVLLVYTHPLFDPVPDDVASPIEEAILPVILEGR